MIDLRGDTCSQPTDAMCEVMARAPVGDDVYGDYPTVLAVGISTAQIQEASEIICSVTAAVQA